MINSVHSDLEWALFGGTWSRCKVMLNMNDDESRKTIELLAAAMV